MITTPVGSLSQQASLDCIWRLEGLAVLAWSLGLYELPRYDDLVDVDDLFPAIGFLKPDQGRTLVDEATLRAPEELSELSDQILAFHWRMRDFSLRQMR